MESKKVAKKSKQSRQHPDSRYLARIMPQQLNPELVRKLPFEFLKKHCAIPISLEDGRVAVAMAEEFDIEAYDAIVAVLARPCVRVVCLPSEIERAISRCYYQSPDSFASQSPGDVFKDSGSNHRRQSSKAQREYGENNNDALASPQKHVSKTDEQTAEDMFETAGSFVRTRAEDLLSVANKEPVIKLVNNIFFQAVHSRASDIHIEPFDDRLRVRFRVDGVLHNVFTLPGSNAPALISRLKVMSNLDIAERRLPQDGQSRIKIGSELMDIRVSVIPTLGGERVVLRLLDKGAGELGLEQLGFSQKLLGTFRDLIRSSHGIILLTGPTGSGKTTTLYAAISELNSEQQNILTVEDPIEYQLAGIGQMQIKPKIGLSFAKCLRHILRQDPNIIMIGEIRDLQTAQIAIQASLTGHLVLSTLHTNDSASAVTRLIDMGVEPYLISSSLIAVMAQRLARVVCPSCKTSCEPDERFSSLFSKEQWSSVLGETVYTGSGCESCLHTGYLGRTGLFELLVIDEHIKELITARCSSHRIKQTAASKGMSTLRQDGLAKVFSGRTSLEEVCRVTQQGIRIENKELERVGS